MKSLKLFFSDIFLIFHSQYGLHWLHFILMNPFLGSNLIICNYDAILVLFEVLFWSFRYSIYTKRYDMNCSSAEVKISLTRFKYYLCYKLEPQNNINWVFDKKFLFVVYYFFLVMVVHCYLSGCILFYIHGYRLDKYKSYPVVQLF